MKEKQNITPERLSALVERARSGDQDAYTALYEATNQEVYRTVRSMVRNEETALDIQQDAYVFAFTHLDQLGDPAKFSPWLRAIAVNRTRSVLRKQTPVLFTELETDEGAGLPEVADLSPDASPELRLERKETADYVREILDELTVGQRMLVGMYYYEQLPVGKIAEDLGVTPGTVKTQLFRSRKKIEAAVKRLEEKGVKLCGLAPLPFLVALLKKQTPAAEAGTKVLSGALTRSGAAAQTVSTVSAAAGTAAPVVEAAAVQVGRSFFQTALGRVVLGVVAAAAIGGGVAGYRWYQSTHSYGDYQPPPTYEIELHADSDEDLTTEPTEEPTLPTDPETNEDLTPETTEPVETTEPTDPVPQPTDPTNPVGAGDPTGPDPTDPTNPVGAGDHTGPDPTDPTDPTEESTEPDVTIAPAQILGWRWEEAYGGSPADVGSVWDVDIDKHRSGRRLVITASGTVRPKLVTDRADLISVTENSGYEVVTSYSETYGPVKEYTWRVAPIGAGTAHVSCTLNGVTAYSMMVNIPEPEARYIQTKVVGKAVTGDTICSIGDCHVGALYDFDITVWGSAVPEISTDHPEIILLDPMQSYTDNWPKKGFLIHSRVVGAGDANVYIKLNGEIKETIRVHATYQSDPGEDTASYVMNWHINGHQDSYMLVKGLEETLYIKIKGQDVPTLYVDDPSVLSVNESYQSSSNVAENSVQYWFTLHAIEEGNCTLYCKLNGETVFSITITVQTEL